MDVRGSRFFLLQTCFKRGQRLRLLPRVLMQHAMEKGLADKKPHGNPTLFVSRERLLYMCPGSFVVFLSLILVSFSRSPSRSRDRFQHLFRSRFAPVHETTWVFGYYVQCFAVQQRVSSLLVNVYLVEPTGAARHGDRHPLRCGRPRPSGRVVPRRHRPAQVSDRHS